MIVILATDVMEIITIHYTSTYRVCVHSVHQPRFQGNGPQINLTLTRMPEDPGQFLIRDVLPAVVVCLEKFFADTTVSGEVELSGAQSPSPT